jgi:proteasome beta subunit
MTLPIFGPTDDPGPNFMATLARTKKKDAGYYWWNGSMDSAVGERNGIAANLANWTGDTLADRMRHGTTIIALRYKDGVIVAGDRRATEGHLIAYRNMEKVIRVDQYSAMAIAGAAGPAMEMARLFSTQLEHYEKVEGVSLSIEGKANQLSQMVREHLALAMRGMVVIPIFAGYDIQAGSGRIYTFDVTGGHYIEEEHAAEGSGGRNARSVLKQSWHTDISRDAALALAIEALVEAADEDIATGPPDILRGIYPIVATITSAGYQAINDDETASMVHSLYDRLQARGENSDWRRSR